MKTVLRFLKPYKRLCVLTLLTMLVDAAGALLIPTLTADMINIGAYAQGSNPEIDAAIRMRDPTDAFLRQNVGDRENLVDSFTKLLELATKAQG